MKIRILTLVLIASMLFAVSSWATESSEHKSEHESATEAEHKSESKPEHKAVELKTDAQKVSYSIGTSLGRSFKSQGVDIQIDAFVRGVTDAMKDREPALTPQQMQEVMKKFQQQMQEKAKLKKGKATVQSDVFLEANKNKQGVITLPSGLQYKVLKQGTGATPKASDRVKTHYRGTLTDGTEFDSSYKRGTPSEFGVTGVIKGWTEALQLMKEGAKWELYIPANLAYGERGRPSIPANSALIFEIELLEIVKK